MLQVNVNENNSALYYSYFLQKWKTICCKP